MSPPRPAKLAFALVSLLLSVVLRIPGPCGITMLTPLQLGVAITLRNVAMRGVLPCLILKNPIPAMAAGLPSRQ